jgi:hypothetical protein
MAKAKVISRIVCLLLCILPVYSIPANDGYCVRLSAYSYVGVHEVGGNNKGFSDYYFRQLMVRQGWVPGYAWCSFFVMGVLDECGIPNTITGWSPSAFNRKDVIFDGGKFLQAYHANDVLVMTLSYGKSSARYKGIGHTGIVDKVNKTSVRTIEGNTNQAGTRDSRTGDAVLVKIRPLTKNIHITRWAK